MERSIETANMVRDESGVALVTAILTATALGALVYATTLVASAEVHDSQRGLMKLKAMTLAEAGVERAIWFTRDVVRKSEYLDPLRGLKKMLDDGQGGYKTHAAYTAEPVLDAGKKLGEFTASLSIDERAGGLDVTITSTGYFPAAPQNMPKGSGMPFSKTVRAVVRVEHQPSKVFDNSYFLNNWGWFYGSTIFNNGNARSNGQFDAGNYSPTITGQAAYDSLAWNGNDAQLVGYQDTNQDALLDGKDGGIFAGWAIAGASKVKGEGGKAKNQHQFQDQVAMPNLTDLTMYEDKAKQQAGQIKVGSTVLSNAVYGDEPGEKQNLYLIGTAANPIEINGTVVVRGGVVIAGVIKGQGSIFAGDNIYVPNNLTYADPPATPRPSDPSTATQQSWITANKNKDMLGLFARENIVLGNHTNSTWRSNVSSWLNHSGNKSKEDAGDDGIPNTKKGRDGMANTVDDDVLEEDGVFTTEKYTEADEALGLIPPGKNVGDVIPGTGEDIDGDGKFDPTIGLADLDLPASLTPTNWGGNIPAAGVANYSTISNTGITQVNATLYTNHALAWVTQAASAVAVNGSVVARNESIIYSAPSISFNYDCRLLGGNTARAQQAFELPKIVAPIRTLSWTTLSHDPHQAVVEQ